MTFNFLLRKALLLSAIFFLATLFSCKKDGKLAPDFDKGNLTITFVDTFSVKTSLVQEDSARTDVSNAHLLGLYNDPIFGLISSSIYTQINLTGVNVNFNTVSSTYDSIVLTLDYAGFYGDTASPMSIEVYELDEDLFSTTDYYSSTTTNTKLALLGSATFVPNLSDSVSLANGTVAPHLRIKLDNTSFGSTIFNADTLTVLNNNSGFITFMKGLHIKTTNSVSTSTLLSGEGSIGYFDMNSTQSTLTIYYNDTSFYDFTIDAGAVKYSQFEHNYTGTNVEKQLNNDPTQDSSVTYVATMERVRTKIMLPTIKDLIKDGTVIINKAELIFTVENGTETTVDEALKTLSLVGIQADGSTVFLLDFFEGANHYGGTLDATAKTYTYNISRHLHQLLYETTTDFGMYLVANGATTTANRSVISSENSSNLKIKLEITYSKL